MDRFISANADPFCSVDIADPFLNLCCGSIFLCRCCGSISFVDIVVFFRSMSRLYSHPREYVKLFLGSYLCSSFVPRATNREETKWRFCQSADLANGPSFQFWGFRRSLFNPRSSFLYRGSFPFCALIPIFWVQEHPPKPPFWKSTFCEPQT